MSLILTREALSNQIADDLATRNTNAGLIEGAVNQNESDISALEINDALQDGRLDTLEGTGEGSVAKAIDDAVSPLAEVVDTNRLYSDSQYLALKAQADAQALEIQASRAELYNGYKILQFGSTDIIGKGTKADYSAVDVSANVVDGKLSMEQKGLTITNAFTGKSMTYTMLADGIYTINTGEFDHLARISDNGQIIATSQVCYIEIEVLEGTYTGTITQSESNTIFSTGFKFTGIGKHSFIRTTRADYTGILYNLWLVSPVQAGTNLKIKINIVNLTALGLDTITDTDILAKLLPYVDGTQNVGKMGMRVVGRNILPPNYFINGYRLATDGTVSYYNSQIGVFSASPVYIPVVPNSHYTINRLDANRICAFYDRNRNFIGQPSVFYGFTGLTPANCYYIRIGFNYLASQQEDLYMVRTLTQTSVESMPPYEPYQEQLTFLPAIGNRLPNGTADSIKTVADGWEHTKRVQEYTLLESDITSLSTAYTNIDVINIPRTIAPDWINYSITVVSRGVGKTIIPKFTDNNDSPVTYDSLANVWKNLIQYTVSNIFSLAVPKGTYASLAEAQADLAGTVIYYQLATPVITHYDLPLPTSGKTIHRFAGEEKIALYGTGLTFSENVLSVLSAVKFVAGVMTDITSLATITTNTVTFSGVSATDVVYVKVEHDVDRPLGILEHTPAVSNTASRLASLEARVSALEV